MKKTILISTAIATGLTLGSFSFAYMGQGQGHGQGGGQGRGFGKMLTAEERAKLQSMSPEERQQYVQQLKEKYGFNNSNQAKNSHGDNPANIITNIPASELSDTEKQLLIDQYGEEKLAHDLYIYAYEKYGLQIFKNIANSETKHEETLKVLFDRYGLTPPTDYAKYTHLYETLKAEIDKGLENALKVGVKAEIDDIEAIYNDILATDNDDIKAILVRIGGASYNHLRGFSKALKQNGFEIPSEVYNYLSTEELNTRGPLNYKMAERVEKAGIKLPEIATSEYLKNNCHNTSNNQTTKIQKRYGQNNQKRNYNISNNQYITNTKKERIKNLIKNKYSAKINKLSSEKIQTILSKIDNVKIKILNSTTLTKTKKELYILVLDSLKEILQERLNQLTAGDMDNILNEIFRQ